MKHLHTGFLITARLKSTRLPKKLLLQLCNRTVIAHLIDRIKHAESIDTIVLCTSGNPQDLPLIDIAQQENIVYYCGDEEDVLKRLYDAAIKFNIDYILNITADCPCVEPLYIDKIVDAYTSNEADLITAYTLPHGAFCYGIKTTSLKKVIEIKDSNHTEVWLHYFKDTDLFEIYDLPITNEYHRKPGLRMTLDYVQDYEFFKKIFEHLYEKDKIFNLDDILHLLDKHPEFTEINKDCKDLYLNRWNKQSPIKLKSRYEIGRIAIIGAGSIGQRHIKNLKTLGYDNIIALRSYKGFNQHIDPHLNIKETDSYEELIKFKPDIAFITNPSSMHLNVAMRLLPHIKGLFIEKPLSNSLENIPTFLEMVNKYKTITFVGFNLQFHPVVKILQKIINSNKMGDPLSFQCSVGQWLPNWHPYEDYKNAYYARKNMGGGALLTLIHEIHLATELFGEGKFVSCMITSSEKLPIDVDVSSDIMIKHSSNVVSQIHLDFLQHHLHRCGIISFEKGWIKYDIPKVQILFQDDDHPDPTVILNQPDYDVNLQYIEELKLFFKYFKEGRMLHNFDVWKACNSLKIVCAGFRSSNTKSIIEINDDLYSL